MAVESLVASDPVTGQPRLALITENGGARIVDAKGEHPGSAAALVRMRDFYKQAGVPMSPQYAFELYATANGNLAISDPIALDVDFAEAATAMRNQLAAAISERSPERQGALDRVRRAREQLAMDSPSAYVTAEEGLDEAWKPQAEADFRAAAGEPPIPYTPEEQAERVAFLQQWLAEQPADDEGEVLQ